MKSFECSSPSELDKPVFGQQSMLSALSLDQLSTSKASNETTGDGSETRNLAFFCLSSDAASPSQATSVSKLNIPEKDSCHLAVPLQIKSSTPYMFLPKQKKPACFDQSFGDINQTPMSWDVSLIKSENSPKLNVDSSVLESTWSPKPQSVQLSPWWWHI